MRSRSAMSFRVATFLCLLSVVFSYPHPLNAQDKPPVFWTHGGNWGNWLKITAHPRTRN
jgi:hypothetical protein